MIPASPAETCDCTECRFARQGRPGSRLHCPSPTLHQVEGAPIQKLADLLRAATEFDEIAWHLDDEYDLLAIELERIDALRAAVRTLQGPATGGAS